MLDNFFTNAFEVFQGSQSNPAFRDSIYGPAGTWLIVLTSTCIVFYYYVLNVFWARYSRTWPHWTVIALCCLLANWFAVLMIERPIPDLSLFGSASLSMLLVDGGYALLGYFLLSLVAKWGSPNARRTPF